jgi:GNAT superfamily N-acetyltransferase
MQMKGTQSGPVESTHYLRGLGELHEICFSKMTFREITTKDIPALFAVRTSVRENTYTREGLYRDGITEETVAEMIGTTHRGWLCEADSKIVGFAMANGTTGEFWVIAVLPDYEVQGIGSKLLLLAEDWLWGMGWEEIWLWTSLDTRLKAYSFYRNRGWTDAEIRTNQGIMKKRRGD